MKFKEVLNHLTGISAPIFGVSWKRPGARRLRDDHARFELKDRND